MSAFNKALPPPAWLFNAHENKNTQRGQRYYIQLYKAQPDWANVTLIRAIYRTCKRLGPGFEVDHIVPLNHPLVSGLHVPYNLRIIDSQHNRRKSNNTWPDMPYLQGDLFENSHAHEDFMLI